MAVTEKKGLFTLTGSISSKRSKHSLITNKVNLQIQISDLRQKKGSSESLKKIQKFNFKNISKLRSNPQLQAQLGIPYRSSFEIILPLFEFLN